MKVIRSSWICVEHPWTQKHALCEHTHQYKVKSNTWSKYICDSVWLLVLNTQTHLCVTNWKHTDVDMLLHKSRQLAMVSHMSTNMSSNICHSIHTLDQRLCFPSAWQRRHSLSLHPTFLPVIKKVLCLLLIKANISICGISQYHFPQLPCICHFQFPLYFPKIAYTYASTYSVKKKNISQEMEVNHSGNQGLCIQE